MAIDRGGLDYPIRVRDQFSSQLSSFRRQAKQAKEELLALRRAARGARKRQARPETLKKQNAAAKQLERTRLRSSNIEDKISRQIGKENIRLRQQLKLTRDIAQARRAAGLATVRQQVPARRRESQGVVPRGSGSRVGRTTGRVKNLNKELFRLRQGLDRATPSFKTFIVAIGASIVIRETLNIIQNFVTGLVSFSAQIEQAELGIAGLISAVSTLRDPFGNVLEGEEALNAAIEISQKQLRLLQADALNTAATFEELADAFQVALAPGTQAGLNTDQIRQFTVRISQAASAIGLAQNQLAEEVRSLFAGTITPRNTRIATALGITNEDIRTAKQAGNLFEFLTDRFEAFGVAGERALTTFTARLANLRNAFQIVVREGGEGFFEFLSDTVDRLRELLLFQDETTGLLEVRPEALEAIEAISTGLERALGSAVDLGIELGGDRGIVGIAEAIGNFFAVSAEVLRGMVLGVKDALSVIGDAAKAFGELFGATSPAEITRLITKFGLLGSVLAGVTGVVITLTSPLIRLFSLLGGAKLIGSIGRLSSLLGQKGLSGVLKGLGARLGIVVPFVGKLAAGLARLAAKVVSLPALAAALLAFKVKELDDQTQALRDYEKAINDLTPEQQVTKNLGLLRAELVKLADSAEEGSGRASEALSGLDDVISSADQDLVDKDRIGFLKAQEAALQGNAQAAASLAKDFGASEDAVKRFFLSAEQALEPGFVSSVVELEDAFKEEPNFLKFVNSLEVTAARSRDALEGLNKELDKIKRATGNLRIDLEVDDLSRAATGGITDPSTRSLLEVQLKGDARTEQRLEKVQGQIASLDEEASRLKSSLKDTDEALESMGSGLIEKTDELENLARTIKNVGEAGSDDENQVDFFAGVSDAAVDNANDMLKSLQNQGVDVQRLLNLLQQRIALQAQVKATQEGITSATREEAQLRAASNTQTALELAKEASQQELEIRRELKKTSDEELRIQQEIQNIKTNESLPRDQQAFQLAQAQLRLLEQQRFQEAERFRLAQQNTQAKIQELRAQQQIGVQEIQKFSGKDEEPPVQLLREQEALERAIVQLQTLKKTRSEEFKRTVQDSTNAINEQQEKVDKRASELTLAGSIERSFDEMLRSLPTKFEMTFRAIQLIVDGFARIASNAIVDALDPTAEEVDLKERFARLLQDLARMLIQWAIRMAIIRAVAMGTSGAGGTNQLASAAITKGGSLHTGGPVAQGYSSGGDITRHPFERPSNLHPSDTVPIWAAPGEFMMRRRAVAQYGSQTMDAINRGAVDPYALSALAGARKTPRRPPRRRGSGFAAGGEIPDGVRSPSAGRGAQPVLVISDREAELFGTAGSKGQVRSLRKNSLEASAALRFGR